jgi:RNA polymerase sigma-70 factor (ECF subfamily)
MEKLRPFRAPLRICEHPTTFPGRASASGGDETPARGPRGHFAPEACAIRDRCSTTDNLAAAHDAELVRRFNAGDEDAFIEIVTRHREKMFSIALGHLGNRADAEEIAQDTIIRAYRGLARFRGDSSLATWLYRIAFNLSRNRSWYFFRRHRHETDSLDCVLGDDDEATLADLIASDAPDPAREAANREFFANVTRCLGKLSAKQNEILTLRNLLDRSYEEIAETLGLSLGTVKSRIARARKNLRRLLAQTYGELEPGASLSFPWFEPSRTSGRQLKLA